MLLNTNGTHSQTSSKFCNSQKFSRILSKKKIFERQKHTVKKISGLSSVWYHLCQGDLMSSLNMHSMYSTINKNSLRQNHICLAFGSWRSCPCCDSWSSMKFLIGGTCGCLAQTQMATHTHIVLPNESTQKPARRMPAAWTTGFCRHFQVALTH